MKLVTDDGVEFELSSLKLSEYKLDDILVCTYDDSMVYSVLEMNIIQRLTEKLKEFFDCKVLVKSNRLDLEVVKKEEI